MKGPIPRKAPYAQGRFGRPYVPQDTKAWRKKIASAFLSHGGRLPKEGEKVYVYTFYGFEKSHADGDSLYHSVQDAISKDALGINDNNFRGSFDFEVSASSKKKEWVDVRVLYA